MVKILIILLAVPLVSAQGWTTITVYDTLQEDCRNDTSNKDFGDPAGDAYFQLKDMYLPYACVACKTSRSGCKGSATFDCNNPESSGNLVVRKVEVEVKLPYGEYSLCNVQPGGCTYDCRTLDRKTPTGVGMQKVCGGGGGYVCYKEQCYPSSQGTENQTQCEETCGKTPSGSKYACFAKKCYPSLHGKENQTECEKTCGKTGGAEPFESFEFPPEQSNPPFLGSSPSCIMASAIPSAASGSQKWDFWNYNAAGTLGQYVQPLSYVSAASPKKATGNGTWFSLSADLENKAWRNAKIVKVINAECHASALNNLIHTRGKDCFNGCPAGSNSSSECYASCIFDTTLGTGSGSSATPTGGIAPTDITSAWLKGFVSDDVSQGGCPACPHSGSCSPPKGMEPAALPLQSRWRGPAPRHPPS
jgi:hypothetical protein